MWSYNHEAPSDRYDPDAAKQRLKDAGFAHGFATDLWVMPVERAYNPNPRLMGEMIQRDLAAIGVQAEIKTYEWSDHYKRMTLGEHQMGLLGWTGYHSDPDYFFRNLLSCKAAAEGGTNVAKFCHPTYEALIQQARQIANPTQRIPLYEEAQRIFKEQAPWLTIAYGKQIVVIRKEVLNFRLNPFGLQQFYGVELIPTNQNSPEQKQRTSTRSPPYQQLEQLHQ
jgi:dipeptide transport system substrate-binding protein